MREGSEKKGATGSHPRVLNPLLYSRLKALFGKVLISRRGEARVVKVGSSLFHEIDETPKVHVVRSGEQHLVECCFCDDLGQNLSINHRYGTRDESGRRLTWLAYCHNKNCLRLWRNRVALAEMLEADDGILEATRILQGF